MIQLTHLGAAGWEITDGHRLLRALESPPLVFATHWDEQSFPYGAGQDERLREVQVFVNEVEAVSPRTRVIVPRHFERHALGR